MDDRPANARTASGVHSHRWPDQVRRSGHGTDGIRSALRAGGAIAAIGRQALRAGPFCSMEQSADGGDSRRSPRARRERSTEETPTREAPSAPETRVNERIRVPEVRLIGPGGEQVGIVRIEDVLRVAADADLDLVEVAPDARPPVCKIMDYGKFKYETAQKARESRKNQQQTVVKGRSSGPRSTRTTRDQEGSRDPLPGSRVQGQGHDHVPRPRAVQARTGLPAPAAPAGDVADHGFVETSAKSRTAAT